MSQSDSQPNVGVVEIPQKKFKCPVCGKSVLNLQWHIYKWHPDKYVEKSPPLETYKTIEETKTVKSSNGIEILPVKADDYMVKSVPKYVPIGPELQIFEAHLESGIPILLVGPKGEGKTLSLAYFAYTKNIPIIQFDCSENTKRFDLIGRFIIQGDQVKYLLGAMPTAIEVANQKGAAMLVLEEINALTPQQQKVLNQLLDWRRHVYIPEIGKTYRLKEGVKFLIAATMNPSTYGGVFELNEDLKSRFAEYVFFYPSKEDEKKILNEVTVNLDDQLKEKLILLASETRAGVNRGELSYALSTRDLVMFANVYNSYLKVFGNETFALKYALKVTVVNRYTDKQEIETIKARIVSIFGEEV